MKKWHRVLISILLMAASAAAGFFCSYGRKPEKPIKPLSSMILPVNPEWIEQYGNSDRSMFGYNLAVLIDNVGRHEQRIKAIEEKLKLKGKSDDQER